MSGLLVDVLRCSNLALAGRTACCHLPLVSLMLIMLSSLDQTFGYFPFGDMIGVAFLNEKDA